MRSIRNQLLVYLIPGVLLIAVIAGVSLYAYMDEVLERAMDSALAAKAGAIAAAVHVEADGQPHLQAIDIDNSRPRHEEPFYFQLFRADGRTVARVVPPYGGTAPLPGPHNLARRFSDASLADGTTVRVTRLNFTATPRDQPSTLAHSTIAPAGERLTLVVAQERRMIDKTLAVLLGGLAIAAAVMTAGASIVVAMGVRRILRPLAHVSILADQINAQHLDIRFPAGRAVPLELRPISGKLNALLDRIAAAFVREKRFSAAVAHELRTPLAELQTACEVALRWPDDAAGQTAALTDALATTRDMSAMVRNLLALARGDTSERVEPQTVVLAPLLGVLIDTMRPTVEGRRLTYEQDVAGDVTVRTDVGLLKAVLRNLLENAIGHATSAGRCRVSCWRADDGSVVIEIGNSCDDLDAGDLAHLTEPFWQKSSVRSSRDHSGLGLSIVDAYCKILGADLRFTLNPSWLEARLLIR